MPGRDDTDIGGPHQKFPATRKSAIAAAGSTDPAERLWALDFLVAAYWKPTYKYIRMKWRESNENAKDLTQSFFARAIEKDFFRSYDDSKASFRTFIRVCVDAFVANELKFASRQRRVGDSDSLPLDFEMPDDADMDTYFQKEWVASLFGMAVDRLENECNARNKTIHFQLFERYDLSDAHEHQPMTYAQLASEFGISSTDVTNYLCWVRREFRRIVLDSLRQVTRTEREFRDEARLLFGEESL
jgi:DNA-directed RNA polymerase specialized sigma24 family protein